MIKYRDEVHRASVISTIKAIGKVYEQYDNEVDLYYLPAVYLLTSDRSLKDKCLKYITSDGIKFSSMLENEDFSSSEFFLVDLAWHLFNNNGMEKSIMDAIGSLDSENWSIFFQALELRRESKTLSKL